MKLFKSMRVGELRFDTSGPIFTGELSPPQRKPVLNNSVVIFTEWGYLSSDPPFS